MSVQINNEYLSLEINTPGEVYHGARFDSTGQIVQITYLNRHTFCTSETLNENLNNSQGRGLYNEFGIDKAIGYKRCKIGESFPKIGVGELTKVNDKPYDFFYNYEVKPYSFTFEAEKECISFMCKSSPGSIFPFILEKKVSLDKNNFTIHYTLYNSGSEEIRTNEYVHNFLSINKKVINEDYRLNVSFPLYPDKFTTTVNPDEAVCFEQDCFTWNSNPTKPFYFKNIETINEAVGTWTLVHLGGKVGITEISDLNVQQINLWGHAHVVSPEIFIEVNVAPGKSFSWKRTFTLFTLE